MAREKRLYYANAVYHVCCRGNNKQPILKNDADKTAFLKSLTKYKRRFSFSLYGFVLMHNHVHLVIGTNASINISKIMQALALSYSQKFRSKYKYTGYVWQGRFKSKLIEDNAYILNCIDYIHHNPVRAGLVANIRDYPWSSYHFYSGGNNFIKNQIKVDKIPG